ncbi:MULTISPECIES: DUF6435 family protein [Corallincola]|uniref:Lacal_2735 family protein n=3 Tax=Corallincola TaxID=1775176 RepID=A0A368NN25_9GAMM|nr:MULTISPECIES: DUF6435 family protein [Corallincola]RCU51556.1 Lacal_2735 family protein [Corallincola holothuriorum]TAA47059.1 Lacal_2735 family protein [Corallincola spongiicola]TCI04708.1 Lacal_2735 family protein [Corallincola luteus]
MLNFLRPDPVKRMKKRYNSMLESAMLAQRRGDIMSYSMISAEAETLWGEIEALQQSRK